MKWMKKNLRTSSCTKLYEIAVRNCTKCCTKSVFKTLIEDILAADPFENKGFLAYAGVRSGLYFLPHGESTSFTSWGAELKRAQWAMKRGGSAARPGSSPTVTTKRKPL